MIKPEQIPKEALGEMVRVLSDTGSYTKALAAALNAWPGMRDSQHVSFDGRAENAIILPLPARSDNA